MRTKRLELLRDTSLQLKWRLFTKFQHVRLLIKNFNFVIDVLLQINILEYI